MLASLNTAHAAARVGTIGPPEPPPANNGGPRTPPPPRATTAAGESPGKGSLTIHPRAQPRWDVRGSVRKIPHSGYGAKPEEGQDTKATYPDHHRLLAFEFGDEFVPAENLRFVEGPEPAHHFDAAFGWIRHLGPWQEGDTGMGWGARLGSATEEAANQPLPAARPPPAASQQIIANLHWTPRSSATGKESSVSAGPPCCGPGPPAGSFAPSPPARDHEAGGLGDAQGAIPARLSPPGLRRAQPSCISTTALRHLQARPSAPPRHGDITAEIRLTLGVSAAHPGTCSQPLYLKVGGQGLY